MKWNAILGALCILLSCSNAWPAGIALYQTGAPDRGTASAGGAAMAADASTAAGMTLLDRSRLLVAGGAMLPDINFDRGPQTTVPGGAGGGGNAGVFFAIGSAFYVYKLPDRIRLGIAYASYFGLASDYSLNRVGHYYLTTNSIITGEGNPSIPYRMNEWLSVGADFSFQVARFYQQGRSTILCLDSQMVDSQLSQGTKPSQEMETSSPVYHGALKAEDAH